MYQPDERKRFLDAVCAQVRWRKAHGVIRAELAGHMEDQAEAFVAQGLPEEEAMRCAVREMGDPEEIGLAYDACLRPKRQWDMVCLLALAILLGTVLRLAIGSSAFNWSTFAALVCGGCCSIFFCSLNPYELARRAWLSRALFVGFLLLSVLELGGAFTRHAAAFLPVLFAAAVYSLRGRGFLALLACTAALIAAAWALTAVWSMRTALYAAGILAGCLFAAVLAALSGAFGKRRLLAVGFLVGCMVLALAAVIFMDAYRLDAFVALLRPRECPAAVWLAPGFGTVQDVVAGARLIGQGTITGIVDAQGLAVASGRELSANSYLLTQLLHRCGFIAALAAAAVPLGFIGAALWRSLHLKSLLGRMLAGAASAFFAAQALAYCAVNFGLLGGLPLSLPFLAGGELALAANLALAGLILALLRTDGLYADRMRKQAKRLRIQLEWA